MIGYYITAGITIGIYALISFIMHKLAPEHFTGVPEVRDSFRRSDGIACLASILVFCIVSFGMGDFESGLVTIYLAGFVSRVLATLIICIKAVGFTFRGLFGILAYEVITLFFVMLFWYIFYLIFINNLELILGWLMHLFL